MTGKILPVPVQKKLKSLLRRPGCYILLVAVWKKPLNALPEKVLSALIVEHGTKDQTVLPSKGSCRDSCMLRAEENIRRVRKVRKEICWIY